MKTLLLLLLACLTWPTWAQEAGHADHDGHAEQAAPARPAAPPRVAGEAEPADHDGHAEPDGTGQPAEPAEHADHTEPAGPAAHADTAGHDEAPAPVRQRTWAGPLGLGLLLLSGVTAVAGRPGPRRRAWWGVAAVGGLLGLGLLLAGRPQAAVELHDEAAHAAEPAGTSAVLEVDPEAAQALGLATETVAPADLAVSLQATGRLLPVESREAHLGPRLAGRLTSVRVRVGDRVGAGEVVATLDSVDAAQAAAAYRESVGRLRAAESHLATRRRLAASGTYTAAPLEDARRQHATARVEQARAASELARSRNEVETARAELARVERLAAGGSFTTAAEEEARQRLATAESGLAAARNAVAEAEADATEARGAVEQARQKVTGAEALAARTTSLAATGDLDQAPLEQAQTALAAARSRLQQADAALDQAQRQARRGEQLHEAELIALNDLENRRSVLREREAQQREAAAAVTIAAAALRRQEQISAARMTSGRAEQEARNTVAEARRELAAAEARQGKATARIEVVHAGVAPAEAAVTAARTALQRERALAGDRTRADSAVAEARLRLAQSERSVAGQQQEAAETARVVAVAAAALQREERLAQGQVRAREQLLETERELQAARIACQNAAEVLQLLGASARAASRSAGPLEIPIRSPLAGLVTVLDATVGEAVSAEQDLLTVVDLSEVYVEADVAEKDLSRVREGQLVRVAVRAFPAEVILGTVTSISGRLDPETRAAHVRARLSNPDWRLRPEMFATVGFVTDRATRVLTIAEEAPQEVAGRQVVFVQLAPEQYEARPVELGRRAEGRVEITSGLRVGEVVVTRGSYLLKSQQLKSQLGHGHAH